MAITDTIQAKEFTAGAPDITLKGDLRPKEMMASAPDPMAELDQMALNIFGKSLKLLTEDELELLKDEYEIFKGRVEEADGGRAQYGLGSIVKSVKKAVKGVTKGVKDFAKSDLGKAALLIGGGMYAGGLGPFAAAGRFGSLPGAGFLGSLSLPGIPGIPGLSEKGAGTLKAFAIGSLGSAAISAAEAGGLDTSDPNAEVDTESLKGYLSRGYKNLNPNATDEEVFQFVQENIAEYRANGGRIGYSIGTEDKVEMAAGIEGLPININPKGIKELDLRETGGFIPPVGVKEKADDIPAMLSNNEFVFTADAVRAAGGGDIDKGAQLMYDTMKRLESRVV
jgi:hypothetical protein